jgi:autotransporter-associated beta strand protein
LASGATLDLAGVTVAGESLVLQGGTLKDATSQWGGTISMTADSTIDIGANDTLIVSGVISGAHVLTKLGAGTLELNAQNTYSGGTQINTGKVKLGHNAGLGTAAASVASGAQLDLNGRSISNALSVTGSGINNGGAITNSSNSVATLNGAVTLQHNVLKNVNYSFSRANCFFAKLTGSGIATQTTRSSLNNEVQLRFITRQRYVVRA